jgi:thiamine-phosphate pyrophosphorylase
MKKQIRPHSLYLVLSGEYLPAGRDRVTAARLAIEGGVDVIQLREKDMPRGKLISLGMEISEMCSASGVIFIVNDDPRLAVECLADGVHVGQEDMSRTSLSEIRRIVGDDRLIGLSTHSPDEYFNASKEDLDYIAYGPVFPTKTKPYHVGVGDVARIASSAKKPTVFIGGIDTGNVSELVSRGGNIAAAIRSIVGSDDIVETVRMFKKKLGSQDAGAGSISIRINGKSEKAKGGLSVADLIEEKQLNKEHVVIEYNGEILDQGSWTLCGLKAGDTLEIVSFVGGG